MKVLILIFLFFLNSINQEKQLDVNPKKVYESIINDSNIILLDVRTLDEVLENKIDNSINIDFYSEDFKKLISNLNRDNTYYVYCRSGRRSMNTVLMMKDLGFKNSFNLEGGILKWIELNLPIK